MRNAALVGWLNSHTTRRPPGRVTRASSRSAAPVSTTLRSANEIVTASKAASGNGSLSASPATSGTVRPRPAPGPQHPDGEVGAHRVRARPAQLLGRHPGAGADVEHPLPRAQPQRRPGGPPPAPVLPEGEHGVGQVVPLGHAVEHLGDLVRLLVQVCARHACLLCHLATQNGRDGDPSRPCLVRYIYDRHRSGPTPPPTVMSRGDASELRCYAGQRNQRERRVPETHAARYRGATSPSPLRRGAPGRSAGAVQSSGPSTPLIPRGAPAPRSPAIDTLRAVTSRTGPLDRLRDDARAELALLVRASSIALPEAERVGPGGLRRDPAQVVDRARRGTPVDGRRDIVDVADGVRRLRTG